MTESEMKAAVLAFKLMEYSALKTKMQFMESTHKSDHVTPTHVNLETGRPKSFYMKKSKVDEQQGTKIGRIGWGGAQGPVKNLVQVPGVVSIEAEDEGQILYSALRLAKEFMVVSADDSVGGKLLYITAIPSGYAGFSYLTKSQSGMTGGGSTALPVEVHYNVVCIRAAGENMKLLSTYPAHQSYIDGLGTGYTG